jgi:Glycosyl transferases group 1
MAETRAGVEAAAGTSWSALVGLLGPISAATLEAHVAELRTALGPTVPIAIEASVSGAPSLPSGVALWSRGSGSELLSQVAARGSGGHLLVLLGQVVPDGAIVRGLLDALELDPLAGQAVPRFANAATDGLLPLPAGVEPGGPETAWAGAALLPTFELSTEHLAACFVVRREVVAAVGPAEPGAVSLPAALLTEAVKARRRGFRTLVMNKLVVRTALEPGQVYPTLAEPERLRLFEQFPDAVVAEQLRRDHPHRRFERLASAARRATPGRALPVLVDARGMQAHHNGTSEAALGLLGGIAAEAPPWAIDLLVGEPAVGFHDLARRFPGMRLVTGLPERAYAAAVRLDQPWHISTVVELHQRALTVAFNMLDSIAWDVVYLSQPDLDATWSFVAEHSDALFYISAFSQARFGFRFPVGDEVHEVVTLLSLAAEDYLDPGAPPPSQGEQVLIFGNRYDHKAVGPTLDLLARAFPYQEFVGLGAPPKSARNQSGLASGQLPTSQVDDLVRTARLVVFPSFYEGFGLPVVKSLACGKTVLVRASPLWRELAAQMRMPGRLVEYVTPSELVEAAGRALHGEPPRELPLGGGLDGAEPPGWRECARRLVDGVERMVMRADQGRWLRRERAVNLALARW